MTITFNRASDITTRIWLERACYVINRGLDSADYEVIERLVDSDSCCGFSTALSDTWNGN